MPALINHYTAKPETRGDNAWCRVPRASGQAGHEEIIRKTLLDKGNIPSAPVERRTAHALEGRRRGQASRAVTLLSCCCCCCAPWPILVAHTYALLRRLNQAPKISRLPLRKKAHQLSEMVARGLTNRRRPSGAHIERARGDIDRQHEWKGNASAQKNDRGVFRTWVPASSHPRRARRFSPDSSSLQ